MSRGRHAKKSSGAGKIVLIVILVLVLAAAAVFAVKFFGGRDSVKENLPAVNGEEESELPEDEISEEPAEESSESEEVSEEAEVRDETSETPEESPEESTPESSNENSDESSTESSEESKPVELPQQVDAEYEKWLASAMVMGISMDYADFEIKGIYVPKATALNDKTESEGVYVVFTSGGSEYAIYSRPIEEERSEEGTTDLSSMTTGFATFDLVELTEVPAEYAVEYSIDDLQETIAQSMLVSVYYH